MKTDPFKRDRSKFCEYHADHGHSTEDCISLRREIEVFIQNGRLVRFLVEERNREANHRGPPEGVREGLERAEQRRRDEAPREVRRNQERRDIREEPLPNQEVVREIHTIAGGIAGGGTRTRQERLMQEVCKARRCIRCTGLRRRQGRIR
jgi:hypothetical protein